MKFVDVKNDVAFHKIFGNANKAAALISFLNAALHLEGDAKVVTAQIQDPYLYPPSTAGKTAVIDVRVTDQADRHFIVEMQVADREGFQKRVQYYTTREYSSQINRGEDYELLRPTYFIGILNFRFDSGPDYYTHHKIINVKTGECLLDDIQFFFIELPKFKKTLTELNNMIDRWTFFLKNAENLDVIPDDVVDAGLKLAYEDADRHNWSKADWDAYLDAGVRFADQELGRKKAEAKGEIKGAAKKEIEAVLGMEENGVPILIIAKSLKITEEKVIQIIADHKGQ